jgi:molybdopterin-containing oxidoreductase family membrane subunit
VLTLVVPIRAVFGLKNVITANHLDNMAKMLLVTGWVVTYAYLFETFTAWYSGDPFERYQHLVTRPLGPYAWLFWTIVFCNCVVVQMYWSRSLRRSPLALFVGALFIQVGMWSERFELIVVSLHRDFLPSSWSMYQPTWVDGGILFGTISFFFFLFLVFLRLVPFVPLSEVKELRHALEAEDREGAGATNASEAAG